MDVAHEMAAGRRPHALPGSLSLLAVAIWCAAIGPAVVAPLATLHAQVPAVKQDIRAARGLVVSPIFEGWYQLGDATYALFGYYNRNLEEVVDVPLGPANKLTPDSIDQVQPTRFFPGRHYGVFAVPVPNVPKDRPVTEVTWNLTVREQTLAIPAFIDKLYFIYPQREDGGQYPGNTPPIVKLDPAGPSAQGPLGTTIRRTATVLRPLALDVWVTDDGLPPPRAAAPSGPTYSPRPRGLGVTWRVYSGPAYVAFSTTSPAVEQGKAQTVATFRVPGEYTLHVLAMDSRSGAMCCWTNGYVKVTVEGEKSSTGNGSRP
jgi:hypothetical protein